jgi:hypothetical protein
MKRLGLLFIGCWLFVYGSAQTIQWTSFKKGRPSDTLSLLERDILLNTNKYALTTWWNEVKGYGNRKGVILTGVAMANIISAPAAAKRSHWRWPSAPVSMIP